MKAISLSRLWSVAAWFLLLGVAWALWGLAGREVSLPDVPGARFQCLSYTPFRGEQTPFDESLVIPREQIREDLELLAPVTGCVRTYTARAGLDAVVPLARERGMKVLLGTWIGHEAKGNQREVEATLAAANAHPEVIRGIIVGNEVLLRREQDARGLIRLIHQMRQRTALPLTYADVWEFWLQNPELAEHVDFLTIHILPYWEDEPVAVEEALHHVETILARMRAAFPGKEILIGETGWPSVGRSREGATPSVVNQARFIREFIALTQKQGMPYNLIEAFDQPWKRFQEGTVGGHWGLFDGDRRIKFALTGPVSDYPGWRWLALAGGGLAALALLLARGRALVWWRWPLLAAMGHGVVTLGYFQARLVSAAALNPLDWTLAGVGGGALLLGSLILAALALAAPDSPWGGARPTPMASLLRREGNAPERAWGVVRAVALTAAAVLALALVADGRYRAFPVALFLPPALLLFNRKLAGFHPMEGLLASLLLPCAVAGVIGEMPGNAEAVAWGVVVVLLAWPVAGTIGPTWRTLLETAGASATLSPSQPPPSPSVPGRGAP